MNEKQCGLGVMYASWVVANLMIRFNPEIVYV